MQRNLNLNDMPEDMLMEIFSRVDRKHRSSLFAVSKNFNKAATRTTQEEFSNSNDVVYRISKMKCMIEVKFFLSKYYQSNSYHQLSKCNYSTMTLEDAICFTLTRKQEHTTNIDLRHLHSILASAKQQSLLNKEIIFSLEAIATAIEYSRDPNAANNAHLKTNLFNILQRTVGQNYSKPKSMAIYTNLSGLNLIAADIPQFVNMLDFEGTNLTNASIKSDLVNCSLVNANFTNCTMPISGKRMNPFFQFYQAGKFNIENCHSGNIENLLSVDDFQSLRQFNEMLYKEFLFYKGISSDHVYFATRQLAANICVYVATLKLSDDYKYDLLQTAITHPLFRQDPVIKSMKDTFNWFYGFFEHNSVYFSDNGTRELLLSFQDYIFTHGRMNDEKKRNVIIDNNLEGGRYLGL